MELTAATTREAVGVTLIGKPVARELLPPAPAGRSIAAFQDVISYCRGSAFLF
jgi:hypothetical protein